MIVVGSMIARASSSVSADIARQTGSAGGLLLAWIITGVLTVPRRFPTANSPR